MKCRARYFDGITPVPREIEVEVLSDALLGRDPASSEPVFRWSRKHLFRDLSSDRVPCLGCEVQGDARLEWPLSFKELELLLPELVSQRPKLFESVPRVWIIGGASVLLCIVGLMMLTNVLVSQLALHVPFAWEKRYLGSVADTVGLEYCKVSPVARDVLKRMLARVYPVFPTDSDFELEVGIVDLPFANAFALPGGNMAFTQGFVEKAKDASWMMGVLGHEISHVEYRHVTAQLIRMTVVEAFMNLFSAGNPGKSLALFNGLVQSRFSRTDEENADRRGIERLHTAGLRSNGILEFLGNEDHDIPKFLTRFSSHPEKRERLAYLKRLLGDESRLKDFEVTKDEWAEVQRGCEYKRKRRAR